MLCHCSINSIRIDMTEQFKTVLFVSNEISLCLFAYYLEGIFHCFNSEPCVTFSVVCYCTTEIIKFLHSLDSDDHAFCLHIFNGLFCSFFPFSFLSYLPVLTFFSFCYNSLIVVIILCFCLD